MPNFLNLYIVMTDYSNLETKTFLDFTNNEKLIGEITGYTDKQSFINGLTEYGRYITFMIFAEATRNYALAAEAEKQLGNIANE